MTADADEVTTHRLLGCASSSSLLGALAGVLVDSGAVSLMARGMASVTGAAYPTLAPVVGALGSFITGSTTNSNALFAPLQAEVARLIDVPAPDLLAAQLAGGNAGNALAPVVVLLGLSAVGATRDVGAVVRTVLLPVLVLLGVVVVGTWLLILL